MATDHMGGFICPDDSTSIIPHGGFLDAKKKQVVFFGSCPVCVVAGRSSLVVARINLDMATFASAKMDGLVAVNLTMGDGEAA